jgi:hypothetical protein
MGEKVRITPKNSITIGGIMFAMNQELEYKVNITEKIEKLKLQLNRWLCRDLTLRGKSIVAKTYGMSQLIFSLHTSTIRKSDIIDIERTIFKFLWGNKPERISRARLKHKESEGGINAVDVVSLEQTLKLKQVLGALKRLDYVREIQLLLLKNGNDSFEDSLNFHFTKLCPTDEVTESAQTTINKILKYYDNLEYTCKDEEPKTGMINMVLNMDIESYLRCSNKLIAYQQFRKINWNRANTVKIKHMFRDVTEELYNVDTWYNIMAAYQHLPTYIKDINTNFQTIASKDNSLWCLIEDKCKVIDVSTSKEIQELLKQVNSRVETINWEEKHNCTLPYEIRKARTGKMHRILKNQKLRNIVMRVWHGDIFCNQRMKKFNMVDTELCNRCKLLESIRHQIYECKEAKRFWEQYNNLIANIGMEECQVQSYEDIILPTENDNEISFTLKAIVIKINMQKDRPNYELTLFRNHIMNVIKIERQIKSKNQADWDRVAIALM